MYKKLKYNTWICSKCLLHLPHIFVYDITGGNTIIPSGIILILFLGCSHDFYPQNSIILLIYYS